MERVTCRTARGICLLLLVTAMSALAVTGAGVGLPAPERPSVMEARARSVATAFFRSQNERRYDSTCALFSRAFYATHRLPDRSTCAALLRVSFAWSGPIVFKIGTVRRDGDRVVVRAVADGASGEIVLVKESNDLKILAAHGE